MSCTSFSYVLLRLKVYLANTTAAPGDVIGAWHQQQQGRVGHVIGGAEAAQGNPGQLPALHLLPLSGHVGEGVAGTDHLAGGNHVHRDVVAALLQGQGLAEGVQARLRRGEGGTAGEEPEGQSARDKNNAPVVLPAHVGNGVLADVEVGLDGLQVVVPVGPLHVGNGDGGKLLALVDVVDHPVNPAKALGGLSVAGLDGLLIRHVRLNRAGGAALGLDLGHNLLRCLPVGVIMDHDARAVVRQNPADVRPHPSGGAEHNYGLIFQNVSHFNHLSYASARSLFLCGVILGGLLGGNGAVLGRVIFVLPPAPLAVGVEHTVSGDGQNNGDNRVEVANEIAGGQGRSGAIEQSVAEYTGGAPGDKHLHDGGGILNGPGEDPAVDAVCVIQVVEAGGHDERRHIGGGHTHHQDEAHGQAGDDNGAGRAQLAGEAADHHLVHLGGFQHLAHGEGHQGNADGIPHGVDAALGADGVHNLRPGGGGHAVEQGGAEGHQVHFLPEQGHDHAAHHRKGEAEQGVDLFAQHKNQKGGQNQQQGREVEGLLKCAAHRLQNGNIHRTGVITDAQNAEQQKGDAQGRKGGVPHGGAVVHQAHLGHTSGKHGGLRQRRLLVSKEGAGHYRPEDQRVRNAHGPGNGSKGQPYGSRRGPGAADHNGHQRTGRTGDKGDEGRVKEGNPQVNQVGDDSRAHPGGDDQPDENIENDHKGAFPHAVVNCILNVGQGMAQVQGGQHRDKQSIYNDNLDVNLQKYHAAHDGQHDNQHDDNCFRFCRNSGCSILGHNYLLCAVLFRSFPRSIKVTPGCRAIFPPAQPLLRVLVSQPGGT